MSPSFSVRRASRAALAIATLLVVSAPFARAADPSEPADPPVAEDSPAPAPDVSGVVVTWDAESRRFGAPSPEQSARLAAALSALFAPATGDKPGGKLAALSAPVTIEQLPNGIVRARVPRSHLHTSVIHLDAEGGAVAHCADEPDRARALFETRDTSAWVER